MEAYLLNLIILISIYSILASTLNFIMGYAGIYSLAHAVFFGVGAYAGTFVAMHFSASIFLTLPAAMLARCDTLTDTGVASTARAGGILCRRFAGSASPCRHDFFRMETGSPAVSAD